MIFRSDAPDVIEVAAARPGTSLLAWESTTGVRVTREYVFQGDRYDFDVRVQAANGSREPDPVRPGLELSQMFLGELAGDSYTFHGLVTVDPRGRSTGTTWVTSPRGRSKKARSAGPPRTRNTSPGSRSRAGMVRGARGAAGDRGALLSVADTAATLQAGESVRSAAKVFAGPKQSDLLESTGKGLEALIDYGWFGFPRQAAGFPDEGEQPRHGQLRHRHHPAHDPDQDPLLPAHPEIDGLHAEDAGAGPVLNKLKEKYKGDTTRINQETMNLYKTYKINPLSGCLPMVAQIPVFIALYKGLLVTIELRHAPFFAWINDLSAPEYLWDIHVAGFTLPIRLLPLLMGVSMLIQQKMTPSASMDPMQQKLMLLMPVVFTFMFWGFPTGLVIYWLVNNILSIGQQWLYNRQADAAKAAKA
jgi:YidC/Oxa1 family membrane protein insertase